MRCSKCGFNSFDHNSACPKCGKDLAQVRQLLNLPDVVPVSKKYLTDQGPGDSEPETVTDFDQYS